MKIFINIFVLFFLSACATKESGFLQSYEGLKQVKENLYFAQSQDANLSQYKNLYIPEVKVLVNKEKATPKERQLSIEIKAYTTTAYRKLISKNSSNYTLVDVGQKETIVMQIALSLARINKTKKGINAIEFMPFSTTNIDEELHLVIEVEATDVMTSKVLSRSLKVIMQEKVDARTLDFKAIQSSLDTWLATVVKH